MAKKKRRNRQPNPTQALNNHQLNHLANQILHPIQAQANHQAQATQGFGTALANIYGDIAPTVQHAYDNAANQTASYANGFSSGLQALANQGGDDAAARLAAQGAPQQQIQNVQGVANGASDALYGAGGYIPASSLQREGAAWTAAAAQAPTWAGTMAQQDATRLRMEAIQQMALQRPQLMQQLRDFELQKYAAKINAGYLGNAIAGTKLDQKAERHRHHESMASLALDAAQQAAAASGRDPEKLQEFWDDTHKDILAQAEKFGSRMVQPVGPNGLPNPFADPVNIPLPYKESYKRLWNAYAQELLRRGFSRSKIKALIDRSLRANGIKPHKSKGKGGGHVGGSPLPHD